MDYAYESGWLLLFIVVFWLVHILSKHVKTIVLFFIKFAVTVALWGGLRLGVAFYEGHVDAPTWLRPETVHESL